MERIDVLRFWLWLCTRPGVSTRMALSLYEHFRNINSIYHADEHAVSTAFRKGSRPYAAMMDKSLDGADEILRVCREKNISILTLDDDAYPHRLKQISDPPPVLYYRGMLPDFEHSAALGVVGTRNATEYGLNTAFRLGKELAQEHAIVVSGAAGGIDSAAMNGAISAGGLAVGVLGCGLDIVYPKENGELYEKTAQSGCLLSEFPPGTAPARSNFPRRNRVISGLSLGVVVVEAPLRSGALITASHALDQGRDVFAVPGSLDSPEAAGCLHLIDQGASLAISGRKIMEAYDGLYQRPSVQSQIPVPEPAPRREVPSSQQKKVDKGEEKPYIVKRKAYAMLSGDEKDVYELLDDRQIHVDEIMEALGLSPSKTLVALTRLEVKNLVVKHPGKYYSRA